MLQQKKHCFTVSHFLYLDFKVSDAAVSNKYSCNRARAQVCCLTQRMHIILNKLI